MSNAKDNLAPPDAWKGENNNGRQAMGTSIVGEFVNSSAQDVSPYVLPRKGPRGGAPRGSVGKRNPIMAESLGAHYAPQAKLPGPVPESQPTLANTRWIVQSVNDRSDFAGGSGGY